MQFGYQSQTVARVRHNQLYGSSIHLHTAIREFVIPAAVSMGSAGGDILVSIVEPSPLATLKGRPKEAVLPPSPHPSAVKGFC